MDFKGSFEVITPCQGDLERWCKVSQHFCENREKKSEVSDIGTFLDIGIVNSNSAYSNAS